MTDDRCSDELEQREMIGRRTNDTEEQIMTIDEMRKRSKGNRRRGRETKEGFAKVVEDDPRWLMVAELCERFDRVLRRLDCIDAIILTQSVLSEDASDDD